jgi:hypothetical protein
LGGEVGKGGIVDEAVGGEESFACGFELAAFAVVEFRGMTSLFPPKSW